MTKEDKDYTYTKVKGWKADMYDSQYNQHPWLMDSGHYRIKLSKRDKWHKLGDERRVYIDMKALLNDFDNIKSIKDRKEIQRNLIAFNEFVHGGRDAGRDMDIPFVYDFQRIGQYLSNANANKKDTESLILAKRLKEPLLKKIELAESEAYKIERKYDPLLGDIVKTGGVMGILGSALFFSFNITGNVVSEASKSAINSLGFSLLGLGLFCGVFWTLLRKI